MSKTALVVDDSQSIRQLVAYTLQEAGFSTTEAPDGRKALEILTAKSFSLVITDINMPEMDGLSLVREARRLQAHRYTPILVLTTEARQVRKDEGRAAGATGWLTKPFDPEKLLGVVQKVCR